MTRPRLLLIALPIALVAALAAGCSTGSSSDRTQTVNPPATTASTDAAGASDAPIDLERIAKVQTTSTVPVDLPGPLGNLRVRGDGAVYVRQLDTGRIHRVDPADGSVIASTEVIAGADDPDAPVFIGVAGGSVWATVADSGVLHRFDGDSLEPLAQIELPTTPAGNYWATDSDVLVVNGFGDDEAVWVVDTDTGTVGPRLAVPKADGSTAGFGRIWVANIDRDTVTALDPDTGDQLATLDVGAQPGAVGITSDAVWVSNRGDGTISRIDPSTEHVTTSESVLAGIDPEAYHVLSVFEVDGRAWALVLAGDQTVGGIVELDPDSGGITGGWKLPEAPGGLQPYGSDLLALGSDPETGQARLFHIDADALRR